VAGRPGRGEPRPYIPYEDTTLAPVQQPKQGGQGSGRQSRHGDVIMSTDKWKATRH
jgi:hypothetical protein